MTSYTVTAAITNNTFGGGQLYVLVLDNATMAVTPATGTSSAAYNCPVTTSVAGSRVVGAVSNLSAETTFTNEANSTFTQFGDGTNQCQYGGFYVSNTGTPGMTTVGASNTFSGSYAIAAVEVIPLVTGNVTNDASSPAVIQSASTTSPFGPTASFTPPGGCVLAAIFATDGNTSDATEVATVSSTPSLTWTQQVSVNANIDAITGYVGVWTAVIPPVATGGPAVAYPRPSGRVVTVPFAAGRMGAAHSR